MTSKFSSVFLAATLAFAALLAGCSKAPTEADLNLATAKAKADQCVEPESVIRTKHMDLLMHQRDATMIEGIRTKQHSLKALGRAHQPAGQRNNDHQKIQHVMTTMGNDPLHRFHVFW